MAVVVDVSKDKSVKRIQGMTTVSIEEVDENWALKLLNECEIDDEVIMVKAHEFGRKFKIHHSYPMSLSNVLDASYTDQEITELKYSDNLVEPEASLLSLSAIENQKLALVEKRAAEELLEQTVKHKSNFNLARIKGLFRPNIQELK